MSKRPVTSNKIPLDRLFAVPPGAEDEFTYDEKPFDFDGDITDEFSGDGTLDEDATISEDGLDITLPTPEGLVLVSQVLRRAPGGQQVVDAVFEVEEVEGALKYEMQVVKV